MRTVDCRRRTEPKVYYKLLRDVVVVKCSRCYEIRPIKMMKDDYIRIKPKLQKAYLNTTVPTHQVSLTVQKTSYHKPVTYLHKCLRWLTSRGKQSVSRDISYTKCLDWRRTARTDQ